MNKGAYNLLGLQNLVDVTVLFIDEMMPATSCKWISAADEGLGVFWLFH